MVWLRKKKKASKKETPNAIDISVVRENLEHRVREIFGEDIYISGKIYKVQIVVSDNLNEIYVKMIYEGGVSVDNLNSLYTEVCDKLIDIGYKFYGIREYKDNHEVCVYYIHNGEIPE